MRNKNFFIFGIAASIAVFAFSACAPYQTRRHPLNYRTTGEASWYGPGFSGKKTASGERYNQKALTAAHPSLPLGTSLKVTNIENDRFVVVRINDRGPFVEGRIIDLSKGAAERIGMVGSGTAEVRLEAISAPAELAYRDKANREKNPAEQEQDEDYDTDISVDKSGVAVLISREPADSAIAEDDNTPNPAMKPVKKGSKKFAKKPAETAPSPAPVSEKNDQKF